jgi:hydrogenase nickel incorporation protein HypA/HybF
MHEYSLAQALIDQVEREARPRRALAVCRVVVRVGPLAGVDSELLSTAYRDLRVDTICADAELSVAGEDVVWQCDACGEPLCAGAPLCCPACGLPPRLAGGDALILERIEMEVPVHV